MSHQSKRLQIQEAIKTLLTTAMPTIPVYLGELPQLDGDNLPDRAIAIVIGDTIPSVQQGDLVIEEELPVEIQGAARVNLDEPWVSVEDLLADIKRAIEVEDRRLSNLLKYDMKRGSTRTVPRQEGSAFVGVGVTYLCPILELWGTP